MTIHSTPETSSASGIEFTVLMALLMSIVAISIDALLPALGIVGEYFKVTNINHPQYLIVCIFVGMAAGQLVCGPLSDAMGRKKILYWGIALYLAGTVVCYIAESFGLLVAGRVIQGLGVSAPYVSVMSIVRDKYSGRDMARVMSLVMMIFIMVPAIAPSIGQGILMIGSWRDIFLLYIGYAVVIGAWVSFRLDETLPPEKRIPFSGTNIAHGFREVLRNRATVNYTACAGICFGSFIGYLNSSQQIFQQQFHTGSMFTVYFGALALVLGVASMMNAKLVQRLGMQYICVRSFLAIIASSAVFLGINMMIEVELWMFLVYAAILFFSFGLLMGNLNALAMEPMGHIAGMASAVIGASSSVISMLLGAVIGQLYDNTLIPLSIGFLVLGSLAWVIAVYTQNMQKAPA